MAVKVDPPLVTTPTTGAVVTGVASDSDEYKVVVPMVDSTVVEDSAIPVTNVSVEIATGPPAPAPPALPEVLDSDSVPAVPVVDVTVTVPVADVRVEVVATVLAPEASEALEALELAPAARAVAQYDVPNETTADS